jgi:hypothetical protein
LEAAHRAGPANAAVSRELRLSVVALAGLAPDTGDDPLSELAALVRSVP